MTRHSGGAVQYAGDIMRVLEDNGLTHREHRMPGEPDRSIGRWGVKITFNYQFDAAGGYTEDDVEAFYIESNADFDYFDFVTPDEEEEEED